MHRDWMDPQGSQALRLVIGRQRGELKKEALASSPVPYVAAESAAQLPVRGETASAGPVAQSRPLSEAHITPGTQAEIDMPPP